MNESKKIKNQKLVDNLKSMLTRIQKRKEILIKHQKDNNKKLEKMGFKVKNQTLKFCIIGKFKKIFYLI